MTINVWSRRHRRSGPARHDKNPAAAKGASPSPPTDKVPVASELGSFAVNRGIFKMIENAFARPLVKVPNFQAVS